VVAEEKGMNKLTIALRAAWLCGEASANKWRSSRLERRALKLRGELEALARDGQSHERAVDSMNRKHRKLLADYEATK
jgi:hypothetical protein